MERFDECRYWQGLSQTGEERYKALAIDNMEFLWEVFYDEASDGFHTWKNGEAKYPASWMIFPCWQKP